MSSYLKENEKELRICGEAAIIKFQQGDGKPSANTLEFNAEFLRDGFLISKRQTGYFVSRYLKLPKMGGCPMTFKI